MNGMTKRQADAKKHRIDVLMAKIEDAAREMRQVVGDISSQTANVELQLEDLRSVADELKSIVDRRTGG